MPALNAPDTLGQCPYCDGTAWEVWLWSQYGPPANLTCTGCGYQMIPTATFEAPQDTLH